MVYTVEHDRHSPDVATAIERYRHPVLFYGLATAIPWVTWGIAGYLSHRPSQTTAVQGLTATLGVLGLLAPMLVAAALVWRDPALVRDVRERLLAIRGITLPRALLMLLQPVGALMLATAISLPLGYSPDQFRLANGISFSCGLLPAWLILTAAPIVEDWPGTATAPTRSPRAGRSSARRWSSRSSGPCGICRWA